MARKHFEIEAECRAQGRLTSLILVALCAGNVGMGGVNLALEIQPKYAVRTDADGASAYVRVPEGEPAKGKELKRFVEDVCVSLFSWDEDTKASNRAHVKSRVTGSVWRRLAAIVPGYETSLEDGVRGRVDTEVESIQMLHEGSFSQVEVRLLVEFSGSYAPPGIGKRDPNRPGREEFGYVLTVKATRRTKQNPSGLLVTEINQVQVG